MLFLSPSLVIGFEIKFSLSLVEGETTLTMSVQRGPDSSFVTQNDLLHGSDTAVSMETVELLRNDLEQRLSTWSTAQVSTSDHYDWIFLFVYSGRIALCQQMDDSVGQETWRKLEMVTSDLAQDLCESLRLILEPSQASRLKVRTFISFFP